MRDESEKNWIEKNGSTEYCYKETNMFQSIWKNCVNRKIVGFPFPFPTLLFFVNDDDAFSEHSSHKSILNQVHLQRHSHSMGKFDNNNNKNSSSIIYSPAWALVIILRVESSQLTAHSFHFTALTIRSWISNLYNRFDTVIMTMECKHGLVLI